jgi:hypothetical protein
LAGEPFPHVNDAADFDRRQRGQYQTILRSLAPALLAVVAVGLLLLAGSKRRTSTTLNPLPERFRSVLR